MKTVLVIFVLIVVCMVPIESSYGESIASDIAKNKVYIFAQIQVTNSDGQLVAYLESKKITVVDLDNLNQLLDQNSGGIQKSIITVDGQKYEMIKGIGVLVHKVPTVVSKNIIFSQGGISKILVWADHDGYSVIPGDKVTTTWTIIRPAP
ncbi:MAG: hypothetical protein ACREAD_08870 [Nitrosopumilaceae archaeon]